MKCAYLFIDRFRNRVITDCLFDLGNSINIYTLLQTYEN